MRLIKLAAISLATLFCIGQATAVTVDSFEDGDLDEYDFFGGGAGYFSFSNTNVVDGSQSLKYKQPDGERVWAFSNPSDSNPDLEGYISSGETFEWWFKPTDGSDGIYQIYFGKQDNADKQGQYELEIRPEYSDFNLKLDEKGASEVSLDSWSYDWEPNKWYWIDGEWQQNGTIKIYLRNKSGDALARVRADDTTFSSGGVGIYAAQEDAYFDAISTYNISCGRNAFGCWTMDEGSGQDVRDYSELDNDGVRGTDSSDDSSEDPEWLPATDCYKGQCLLFEEVTESTGDIVKVGNDPTLDLNGFTITAWVYPTTYDGADPGIIVGKHRTYKIALMDEGPQKGTLIGTVYDSSGSSLGSDHAGWQFSYEQVPLNQWSNVGFTWNGSAMKFYVDGELVETAMKTPTNLGTSSYDLGIGGRRPTDQPEYFFDGRIDQVKFLNGSKNVTNLLDDSENVTQTLSTDIVSPPSSSSFDSNFTVEVEDTGDLSEDINLYYGIDSSYSFFDEWNTVKNEKTNIENSLEDDYNVSIDSYLYGYNNSYNGSSVPNGRRICQNGQSLSSTWLSCEENVNMDGILQIKEYTDWLGISLSDYLTKQKNNNPTSRGPEEGWGISGLDLLKNEVSSGAENVVVLVGDQDANGGENHDDSHPSCGDSGSYDLADEIDQTVSNKNIFTIGMLGEPECEDDPSGPYKSSAAKQLDQVGQLVRYDSSNYKSKMVDAISKYVSSCSYRVSEDKGSTWSSWQTRSCPDGNFNVSVGKGSSDMCTIEGSNQCWVQTRITDKNGKTATDLEKYSIGSVSDTVITSPPASEWQNSDFNVDVNDKGNNIVSCEYRINDDSGSTTGWTSRSCPDGDFNVPVGKGKICSTQGLDKCEVEARMETASGDIGTDSVNYNIFYNSTCKGPDTVACWKMDAGSGQSIFDYSGNEYHGVRGLDGTHEGTDPNWLNPSDCSRGNCLGFPEAQGKRAKMTESEPINPGNFTLSADVYIEQDDLYAETILHKEGQFGMHLEGDSRELVATIESSKCGGRCGDENAGGMGGGWFRSGYDMPLDEWKNLQASWNGTHMSFFVDGSFISTQTSSKINGITTASNSGDPVYFALRSNPSAPSSSNMEGNLDEIKIFNYSKSAGPLCSVPGEYRNRMEEGEYEGRIKEDLEYCYKSPVATDAVWYDQDYGDVDNDGVQETCRENNLSANKAVRWVSDTTVESHPNAFKGGIDDDLSIIGDANHESLPDQNIWNFNTESPVPTGTSSDFTSTLGFCGGDDQGEYLITQECKTGLCSSDSSVIGVAKTPDSCVLNGQDYDLKNPANDERKLYRQGENVTFILGSGSENQSVACFGGEWYEQWPISAESSGKKEVSKGQTAYFNFRVINIDDVRRDYKIELQGDEDAKRYVEFDEFQGDSFEISVPPRNSKNIRMKVFGGDTNIDNADVRVQATSISGDISGEDSFKIDIKDSPSGSGTTEPRNVPGIGFIHLIVLVIAATLIRFRSM